MYPLFARLVSLLILKATSRWPGLSGRFTSLTGLVNAPLIEASELDALSRYSQALPYSLLSFQQPASHPLQGEMLSSYRGSGFEFDDNRLYQAGDEPRLINWRLYARTGELYSRLFTEERKPDVFLLHDRRSNMRFGTHKQLKVTLAAQLAACCFQQARQQGLPVAGMLMQDKVDWYASKPARSQAAQHLLQAIIAPCPPLTGHDTAVSLTESLQQIVPRVKPGSFILLISDFLDLDCDAVEGILAELASKHTLRAIQILDPAELHWPAAGDFTIDDPETGLPLQIAADNKHDAIEFQRRVAEKQAEIKACFENNGIAYASYTTQDDYMHILETIDSSHEHS